MLKELDLRRWSMIVVSLLGLLGVYLTQHNLVPVLEKYRLSGFQLFAAAKTIRFLLNDLLMILLIYGLFFKRKYTLFAFYVQIFGVVFLLIPYLVLKSQYITYNGPLISYLHRLIVNPLLMLLLIPALIYKEKIDH